MKEYLKMEDAFSRKVDPITDWDEHGHEVKWITLLSHQAEHAAHAINSHDELVAEVERLTKSAELAIMTLEEVDRVLTERIKNGAYDLDDISGEVTYALDKISSRE